MTDARVLIFISHSSKDSELVLSLAELLYGALGLRDKEIRCSSVDGLRSPIGIDTDEQLKLELCDAEAFVGLITSNSLKSTYVLFELGARWGSNRHMVPVLAGISPEALRGPLCRFNAISADNIAHLHQLVADIAGVLHRQVQSPAFYTRYAEKLAQRAACPAAESPKENMKVESDARPSKSFETGISTSQRGGVSIGGDVQNSNIAGRNMNLGVPPPKSRP